jgi:hypothetical protein
VSKKKILTGSLVLAVASAVAIALLVVGSIAVTPTPAEAGACIAVSQRAWGHGSNCAAALADLNIQAAGLCDYCPFDGSCGAGPSVTNQTSCYYASGKWVIDADINNHCNVHVAGCIDIPPGP